MANDAGESILEMIKIIDKGIALERNAYAFYTNAAGEVSSPDGREVFENLARAEERHLINLIDQRRKLSSHHLVEGRVPTLDTGMTLSEIASSFSFDKSMKPLDMVQQAILNEKKTYSFYTRKLTFATDPSIKNLLKEMAQEEEMHWNKLKFQMHNLETGLDWDKSVQ